MSENENTSKNKKIVLNIVYSVLVFFASTAIGIAVFAPSAINSPNDKIQVTTGGFLALGIGIILTIVFSMWFAKRNSR